jgi:hypothetical protein
MRSLGLLLGLLLLPAALRAADLRPVIRREAGRCAAALQRGDYEAVLAYVPPQMIRQAGGRAAMLREIKDHLTEARGYGIEQVDVSLGRPAAPTPIGRWLTSLVPLRVVLHRAPLDLTQETHLLGLSADQGGHWYFVPLFQVTQQELNARFPELAGKLVVPDDPAPSLAAFR